MGCSRHDGRVARRAAAKTWAGPLACALIGCAACCTSAHADIYAYIKPEGSVLLTNIAVGGRPVSWAIGSVEAEAKPAPSKTRIDYQNEVQAIGREYGVDADLIHAVIAIESNYVSNAVSPKGAIGVMQLMPSMAQKYKVADPSDALQNIRGGVQYLRHLLGVFDGDLDLVLAAYNAGEPAVLKYGRRVPPFPETLHYVRSVQRKYRERKQLASAIPTE